MGIFLKLNNLDQFPGLILRVGKHGDEIEISKHFEPGLAPAAPPPVGSAGSVDLVEQAAHFRRLHSSVRFDETDAMLKIEAAAKALESVVSSLKATNPASIVPKP